MKSDYKLKILYSIIFIIFILLVPNIKNLLKNLKKLYIYNEFNKIFTTLVHLAHEGKTQKPIISKDYKIVNYPIHRRKGICLCSIGKNENLYIREFVEHYKLLGFDKIYIFDNNDINGEKFEDIIEDYIINKFVEIIDLRGLTTVQLPVINYCYQKYQNLYDWIAIFDIDEYLFLKNTSNINDYLYTKRFEKCQSIVFNWLIYDDNDLEKYDDRKLKDRFKRPKIFSDKTKSIVRTNFNNIYIIGHIVGININYFCDSNGNRVFPSTFSDLEYNRNNTAIIKHFYTKSAEEFCNKIKRGDAIFYKQYFNYIDIFRGKLEYFFNINNNTKKKMEIFKKCFGKNLDKYI